MKPVPLLAALSATILAASAMPAQALPGEPCIPPSTTMEADLGLAEVTTVCTVEELLEIVRSIDCVLDETDLEGQCLFCPPAGGSQSKPVGRMSGGEGVFVAYFPSGLGNQDFRSYHVVFIPLSLGACEALA